MSKTQQTRDKINAQVVAALESGDVPPWRRPWAVSKNSGMPTNVISKKPYRGINPLILDLASMKHGFSSKWWGTFNQWKSMGGMVKCRPADVPEGQWGSTVVFWSPISKTAKAEDGTEEEDKFFIMKTFTLFNIDQVEGDHLDHLRAGQGETVGEAIDAEHESAQQAIDATEADIRYGGNQAFYSPVGDYIQLPPASSFVNDPARLLTTFHELCHWTEHPSRLNWSRKDKENTYEMGELVAELGACYLARELGVPVEAAGESAAYLKHWIAAMKGDSGFVFRASSQASKAADFILSFSRTEEAVEEPMAALAC